MLEVPSSKIFLMIQFLIINAILFKNTRFWVAPEKPCDTNPFCQTGSIFSYSTACHCLLGRCQDQTSTVDGKFSGSVHQQKGLLHLHKDS